MPSLRTPSISALARPFDAASEYLAEGVGQLATLKARVPGQSHYIDPNHASYHLPAGTVVKTDIPLQELADTGETVVSINGNGERARIPIEEFRELPVNRRHPLPPDEMPTLKGQIALALKLSGARARKIFAALERDEVEDNPFRNDDTLEQALDVAVAAALKLRQVDMFDLDPRLPNIIHNLRLRWYSLMSGKVKYRFPETRDYYRARVQALLNATPKTTE